MTSLTISEARNNFSSVIAELEEGREDEIIIKNREVPVARITPYTSSRDISHRFGLLKDSQPLVDDKTFDDLDGDIAKMFGVDS